MMMVLYTLCTALSFGVSFFMFLFYVFPYDVVIAYDHYQHGDKD